MLRKSTIQALRSSPLSRSVWPPLVSPFAGRIVQPRESGLTLLEVMIALVILGVVVTGFLQTFAGALRSTAEARTWSQALVYAVEGQEKVKLGDPAGVAGTETLLGGGFYRRVAVSPWGEGVARATVTVILPGGGRFELSRLVKAP